jgi:hypothetical protein
MTRALFAAAVFATVAGPAGAACREDLAEFRWEGGQARFRVEVADSGEERARGLMFRDRMPAGAGMLFVYERPQRATFWMKNTLISLDMIFMDPSGRVTKVHANAVPGDETSIPGPEGTLYVLEINGGLAARLGISPGAEMRHALVAADGAAWPCG